MDTTPLDTVQKDIDEIEKFLLESKRPNISRILKEQLILLQSTLKQEKEKADKENKQNESTTSSSNVSSKKNYVTLTKYAFDNSDKFAKIYFTDGLANLKQHPTEKIVSKFNENSFEVCIDEWNGKNLRFACGNLNKKIITEESYVKATASGLIVYLKKEKKEHWDKLEKSKSMLGEPEGSLDKNKDDPSAGLMNMMKEMYQNGDDNTKRMIAESWMKAQDGKGGMPDMGGMGGMPGMGGMGGMPGMGGMGGMPGMGGMGGMPGMEGMGGMPDMSKLTEMMGNMGGMPDMK